MFQPEPTAYLHLPTGYGLSVPQYAFDETPLRYGSNASTSSSGNGSGSDSGSSNGGGGGSSGGFVGGTLGGGYGGGSPGAAGAAGALLFSPPPIFGSTNNTGLSVGPAPPPVAASLFGGFHATTPAAAATGHRSISSLLSSHHPVHTTPTTAAAGHRSISSLLSSSSTPSPYQPLHRNLQHRPSAQQQMLVKMEPDADDIVAQEAAAREYQPQLTGSLIGKKTPSTAIMEEYAKADPVYVQKTMALPQTYSHYRPVQGDGNCGWRAIGFAYFETLVKFCTKAQIDAERQRLQGLNNYIEATGGISASIFEDFTEETLALLKRISDMVGDRDSALAEVEAAFNNPDIANSVMYHFRLLASTCMKERREIYAAFLTDTTVDGYCQATLERPGVEIEHLGVILLVEILLKPIGFVLEIAYLDRSPGSHVNTYRFPEEANDQHPSNLGPIIHLLFRPDHYDLLYPPELNIQVNRVASFSPSYQVTSTPLNMGYGGDMHAMSVLLGFGTAPSTLASGLSIASTSPISSFTPSPVSPWASSPPADPIPQHQAPPPPQPTPPVSFAKPAPTVPVSAPAQKNPLRLSQYCQLPEYVENRTWREPAFQTTSFKNSHFNVAHYNNPNFQPEEYKPEADDYEPAPRLSKKRGSV